MRISPFVMAALFSAGMSASSAYAQLNNGTVDGAVTIDPSLATGGNNYASLAAFATDFNAVGTFNANWTVTIEGNLTEANNVAIMGGAVAGKTITIKPGAGKTPTINFTNTADNGGFSGHWVLGTSSIASQDAPVPAGIQNLVIDGSNNGTDSRDLTVTNFGGTATAALNSRLINIVGASSNVTVKNVNIVNVSNANGVQGLNIQGRSSTTIAGQRVPTNITVHNNVIKAQTGNGNSGNYGIQATIGTAGRAVDNGTGITGLNITSNTITAKQRGIFLSFVRDSVIDKNNIDISLGASGFSARGILHSVAYNGAGPAYSMTVSRNVINRLRSVDVSSNQNVMGLEIGPTGTGTASYVIANNMIGGFDAPGPVAASTTTAGTFYYRGISVNLVGAGSSSQIYHNSVDLSGNFSNANSSGISAGIVNPASNPVTDFRNNIIRCGYTANGAACARFSTTLTDANFTSDENVYYHAGTTNVAGTGRSVVFQRGATLYPTLAAWQADAASGTRDDNSQEIDPVVGGGKNSPAVIPAVIGNGWTNSGATANLRWSSSSVRPGGLIGVTKLANDDVDGDLRASIVDQAYPGADELVAVPLPATVSAFTLD